MQEPSSITTINQLPKRGDVIQEKPTIPPELLEIWLEKSKPLFERDGTNEKYDNGGHDIKNNPQLASILHEIARQKILAC